MSVVLYTNVSNIQNSALTQIFLMWGVIGRLKRIIILIETQFCCHKSGKFHLVGNENYSLDAIRKAVKAYRKCKEVAEASNTIFRAVVRYRIFV